MRSLMFTSLLCLYSLSTPIFAEEVPAGDSPSATPNVENPAPTTDTPSNTETTPENTAPENAPENTASENTDDNANGENSGDTTTSTETTNPVEPVVTQQESTPAETASESVEQSAADHFTVEQMWAQSSGPVRIVLGTLLFMLVAAMAVGLERFVTLGAARRQSRELAGKVGSSFKSANLKEVLSTCKSDSYQKSYLAHMLAVGVKEFDERPNHYGIEAVERALEKQSIGETAALNQGLNILATVGSTAPFVGLVGTIFGIINAFGQIGAEGGADLTTLAPAIGEALITTAFGIIVAIVGVWLFNFFTATIESISNDMAESSQEFLDWCHKRIIPDEASK